MVLNLDYNSFPSLFPFYFVLLSLLIILHCRELMYINRMPEAQQSGQHIACGDKIIRAYKSRQETVMYPLFMLEENRGLKSCSSKLEVKLFRNSDTFKNQFCPVLQKQPFILLMISFSLCYFHSHLFCALLLLLNLLFLTSESNSLPQSSSLSFPPVLVLPTLPLFGSLLLHTLL